MGQFTKGFLIGALCAAGYTLLHAKRPGRETRAQLRDYLHEVQQARHSLQNSVQNMQHNVHVATQVSSATLSQFSKQASTIARHFQENNGPRLRRIKQRYDTLQQHLADATKKN